MLLILPTVSKTHSNYENGSASVFKRKVEKIYYYGLFRKKANLLPEDGNGAILRIVVLFF
jgi:hypothetical protein